MALILWLAVVSFTIGLVLLLIVLNRIRNDWDDIDHRENTRNLLYLSVALIVLGIAFILIFIASSDTCVIRNPCAQQCPAAFYQQQFGPPQQQYPPGYFTF